MFFLEILGNLVFELFTVKLCIITRNLPGNYLNLIRNQDQEITLRAPGIRVCLGCIRTANISNIPDFPFRACSKMATTAMPVFHTTGLRPCRIVTAVAVKKVKFLLVKAALVSMRAALAKQEIRQTQKQ